MCSVSWGGGFKVERKVNSSKYPDTIQMFDLIQLLIYHSFNRLQTVFLMLLNNVDSFFIVLSNFVNKNVLLDVNKNT